MEVTTNLPRSSFMTGLEYLTNLHTHGRKMGITRVFNRRFDSSQILFSKNLSPHKYQLVTAIAFSSNGEFLASGYVDGYEESNLLLWNMSKAISNTEDQPAVIKFKKYVEVNCLAFHKYHAKLIVATKYSNRNIILYDINVRKQLLELEENRNVSGLSWDPMNDSIFASSSLKCSLWDLRQHSIKPLTLAADLDSFSSVMHHPIKSELLAAANIHGAYLLDVRNPKTYLNQFESSLFTSYVSFDTTGRHLLAVRNKLPTLLHDQNAFREIAEFDYPEYQHAWSSNKSGCFVEDKFVLSSASHDKIYAWKIPINSENKSLYINRPHFVLKGHCSAVNEIKYNNTYGIIASCGKETNIKLWSSFQLPFFEEQSNQLIEEESG